MKTKLVAQLDQDGYFVNMTEAEECPLEKGVYLMPGGTIEVSEPTIPPGTKAKWNGKSFDFEPIPEETPSTPVVEEYVPTYADLRRMEYPSIRDYLDGVVKGDQSQIDDYIAKCQAVKAKYPKP